MEVSKANLYSEVNEKLLIFYILSVQINQTFPSRSSRDKHFSIMVQLQVSLASLCRVVADKRAPMLTHNNDDVFSVTGFPTGKMHLRSLKIIHTKSHREAT